MTQQTKTLDFKESALPARTWASTVIDKTKMELETTTAIRERDVMNQLSDLYAEVLSIEVQKLKERIRKEFYRDGEGRNIKDIIKDVCKHFSVAPENVFSSSRKRAVVDARQLIHWMIKNKVVENRLTLSSIGEVTGGHDHATVIHGVKNVNNRIEVEQNYREQVMMLCNKFGWRTNFENGLIVLNRV